MRAFLIGLLFFPLAASSGVIYVTASGTVSSGSDLTGIFGTADSSLAGTPYSLLFTFDTSRGNFVVNQENSFIGGGVASGSPGTDSPGAAVLTIHVQSVSIPGYWSAAYFIDVPRGDQRSVRAVELRVVEFPYISATGLGGDYDVSQSFFALADKVPALVTTPYSLSGSDFLNSFGYFRFVARDVATGAESTQAFGQFALATIDVTYDPLATTPPPLPVPEPETCALMLAGFGVLGWAARRKKRMSKTSRARRSDGRSPVSLEISAKG